MGVDGIITDGGSSIICAGIRVMLTSPLLAPNVLRRWAQQQKLLVAPRYAKYRVLACLAKYQEIT